MQDGTLQFDKRATNSGEEEPTRLHERALDWSQRAWRPAATALAVALALSLFWHVVHGKNGLTAWHQNRVEDQQLRQQIDGLQQENARLQQRVQQLQSDPDAIGQVARQELHYAKPNEVIVTLPAGKQTQTQPAAGK